MPQLQAVVPVVEVGDGLQATVADVLRQTEGAVGHLREPSLQKVKLALTPKVCGLHDKDGRHIRRESKIMGTTVQVKLLSPILSDSASPLASVEKTIKFSDCQPAQSDF